MSLTMLLKIGGHVIQVAYDGVEAIAKAADFKPDMVLPDIGLPKMNGYDACRAIREQPWPRTTSPLRRIKRAMLGGHRNLIRDADRAGATAATSAAYVVFQQWA